MRTWKIVIEPRSSAVDFRGDGWVDLFDADEIEAQAILDDWAAGLSDSGFVPESGDWRNFSPIQVGAKVGKRRYRVRVDCFEQETETGYSNGYGWLRLAEAMDWIGLVESRFARIPLPRDTGTHNRRLVF